MSVVIDGASLTGADVMRVSRRDASGAFAKVSLDAGARQRVMATRAWLDANFMNDEAPLMYSFNTGVGLFKDQRVLMKDMVEYQTKTVYAHATGVGEPFCEDVARATMLLRANAFASNYSGPRVEVLDRLIDCLNAGVTPVIPQKGSVGASGDLAPLAHMSGAVCGFAEAEMFWQGKRMPAREALAAAGLSPTFDLSAKDASCLINGSTVSLALAVLAVEDSRRILKAADVALAMSLECLRGERTAFEARIHAARPHAGQASTARNVLRMIEGSKRCSEPARHVVFPDENRDPAKPPAPRVQDVYSLRCGPQVHGPVRQAIEYVDGLISVETNSATDNPLVFDNGAGGYEILSGGHFHGQYVAQAMDVLAIAMADLGSICERRLARLVDPTMSWPAAQSACGAARTEHRLRHRAMHDVGAGNGKPHVIDARLCRLHSGQIQRRGPRVQLHLVRTQDAHDRGERRAYRGRRNPDDRAGAGACRRCGEGPSCGLGHARSARRCARSDCAGAFGRQMVRS